ncbi:MAG: DUF1552 domain-containing protein [Myxococcota bacterium]
MTRIVRPGRKSWRQGSRRAFLGSLGAAGVTASLIPLLESESEAGDAPAPKRLILLAGANGTVHEDWKPGYDGKSLQLSPVLAPLEAHKEDLVVVDGLGWQYGDGPGVDHMRICMLWNGTPMLDGDDFINSTGDRPCGWGGAISVDQFLAGRIGEQTPFSSLEYGVQNGGAHIYSRVSYAGADQPIPPEDDPYAMFERLFSEFSQSEAELAVLRARRKSVIDAVKGSLGSLETRVSTTDRVKIEAHLDAVRKIEMRLDSSTTCDVPMLGEQIDANANDSFPAVSRLQIDMMVMAMACDLTRISSLLWARAGSNVRYTWLGQSTEHHSIAHDSNAPARAQITEINAWHAGEVAYLLDALKAVPEGDGTMLDNTLVVWGNELADGWTHSQSPIPLVLAGGAGMGLPTGRYLDYGGGRHNQLLVSICNLMDQADVTSFGSLDDGSGALPDLV